MGRCSWKALVQTKHVQIVQLVKKNTNYFVRTKPLSKEETGSPQEKSFRTVFYPVCTTCHVSKFDKPQKYSFKSVFILKIVPKQQKYFKNLFSFWKYCRNKYFSTLLLTFLNANNNTSCACWGSDNVFTSIYSFNIVLPLLWYPGGGGGGGKRERPPYKNFMACSYFNLNIKSYFCICLSSTSYMERQTSKNKNKQNKRPIP